MSSQVLTDQQSTTLNAWVNLLRSHAAVTRDLSARLVAEHGLTINDYEALLHLSRAEESALRRVDLAERLVMTASGVTRLLDGLERAGYVEKGTCDSDARVTYAVLTEDGRTKLADASCSHIAAIRELFEERLEPADIATLADILGRLPSAAETCALESAAAAAHDR
jgi:DNA-binding MarR family transcriptional regulator